MTGSRHVLSVSKMRQVDVFEGEEEGGGVQGCLVTAIAGREKN